MKEALERLQKITVKCREDMHEPDNQGISAHVLGDHLDNAFGNRLDSDELIICIVRKKPSGEWESEYFNLATLIALARKAVV